MKVSKFMVSKTSILFFLSIASFTVASFLTSLCVSEIAQAQIRCQEQQITNTDVGFSESPSVSADGNFLAFDSDADVIGVNIGGESQIYLYDITNGIFTKITDETSGRSVNPSINADGTRIAFRSNANINGGNADGSNEIYIVNTTNGVITQITNTPAGDNSLAPSISADGTRIAFESDADINGGNPDGSREIWLFDTGTGIFTQITDSIGDFAAGASISADGTLVTFRSNGDYTGGNPGGISQIWLYNTIIAVITQQTSTVVQAANGPRISGDGTIIAFNSRANINGGNPEGNDEIYYIVVALGVIIQVTDEPSGGSTGKSINADGTIIAFNSNADINGGNPEGNAEIYIFNVTTGIISQVTHQVTGGSFGTSLSADGTILAFSSDGFGNPEENFEIFLATCINPDNLSVPTLSQWGLIAMAGALGIIGLFVIRRRQGVI